MNAESVTFGNRNMGTGATSAGDGVRLHYVDFAKGLMLVSIIFGHTPWWDYASFASLVDVPLFFFAAGFTGGGNLSAVKLWKRCRKLLTAYLIISVVCVLYTLRYYPENVNGETLWGILYSRFRMYPLDSPRECNVLLNIFNGPLWFLTAMISSYVTYFFLLKIRGLKWQLPGMGGMLAMAWGCTHLPVLLPWSLDTAPFFASVMLAGRLAREHDLLGRMNWGMAMGMLVIVCVCTWISVPVNLSIRIYGESLLLTMAGSVAGSLLLFMICKAFEGTLLSTWMQGLAGRGYYVFGLQALFINFAMRYCKHFHLDEKIWPPIEITMACVGGYITGVAVNFVISRIFTNFASEKTEETEKEYDTGK